jgi:exodeoxyribonuclease VII small subunit
MSDEFTELEMKPVESMTFEQAYSEIEKIVEILETGNNSLEQSITLYERGQHLARYCNSLLDKAELKIRELSNGELAPFSQDI